MQKLLQQQAYDDVRSRVQYIVRNSWYEDIEDRCLEIYDNTTIDNAVEALQQISRLQNETDTIVNQSIGYRSLQISVLGVIILAGSCIVPANWRPYAHSIGGALLFFSLLGFMVHLNVQF